MKSIFLIFLGSILAMHCVVGANPFDQVKKNIATVKTNIKNTATKIEKNVNDIIQQNQKFLDSNRNLALSLAQININTEITLINIAAEKNPDCVKQYQNEINGAQLKCRKEASSCFDKAATELKNTKNTIAPVLASIKGLETDIDRGVINCVGASTPIDYMVCVTKVLAQVNISLKAADGQAQIIVNQIKSQCETIKKSASPCSDSAVANNVSRLQAIRDDVKQCVGTN